MYCSQIRPCLLFVRAKQSQHRPPCCYYFLINFNINLELTINPKLSVSMRCCSIFGHHTAKCSIMIIVYHDRYSFIFTIYFVTVFLFCLCETSLLMYAGTDAAPRRASPIGILYSDIVCLFSSAFSNIVMYGFSKSLCSRPLILSVTDFQVAGWYYTSRSFWYDEFDIIILFSDVCELLKIYFLLFNIAKILLSEAI